MELNNYDKETLRGIKNHLAKDAELVQAMYQCELDTTVKHKLGCIEDHLLAAQADINKLLISVV